MSTNVQGQSVSPNDAKPNVGSSTLSCLMVSLLSNKSTIDVILPIEVVHPFYEKPLVSSIYSHSVPSQVFVQQIGHNQTKENDNLKAKSP